MLIDDESICGYAILEDPLEISMLGSVVRVQIYVIWYQVANEIKAARESERGR